MRARRTVLAGLAGALALTGGTAQAATSVSVARSCYSEGDSLPVEGAGFSPGGAVRLRLERDARVLESTDEPRADAQGAVRGGFGVDTETGYFGRRESRFEMTLRLVDQTRLQAGTPADSPDVTAATTFTFSRWAVGLSRRPIHPARPLSFRAVGFTTGVGKRLYAHWSRNDRLVRTRRFGVLRGPCGDVRGRLRRGFPFRPVRAGEWTVTFNPSKTKARTPDSIAFAVGVPRTLR